MKAQTDSKNKITVRGMVRIFNLNSFFKSLLTVSRVKSSVLIKTGA